MTAPSSGRQQAAVVASAVGRVLDINPALLRLDTPLVDVGADEVALLAMADLLIEDGYADAAELAPKLAEVQSFGDLLAAVEAASKASDSTHPTGEAR